MKQTNLATNLASKGTILDPNLIDNEVTELSLRP